MMTPHACRVRFWEVASDLTLGLSGWVARRYAAVTLESARPFVDQVPFTLSSSPPAPDGPFTIEEIQAGLQRLKNMGQG